MVAFVIFVFYYPHVNFSDHNERHNEKCNHCSHDYHNKQYALVLIFN